MGTGGKYPRPNNLVLVSQLRQPGELDAEYQRICALGIQPQSAPAQHPSQPVYSFFLEDPNGYTVEFQKIDGFQLHSGELHLL